MDIKNADDLRKAYPELVDQIEQAATEAAATAERERIQSIEDMALPGSEALTVEAKFKTPMSAEDFAKEMVKNAKTQGAAYLDAMHKDSKESGAGDVGGTPTPEDGTARGGGPGQGGRRGLSGEQEREEVNHAGTDEQGRRDRSG